MIKGNLKYLTEIANLLYSQRKLNLFAEKAGIKDVMYGIPKVSNSDMISILREFDFECFKEKTLDGENGIYEKLENVIKKYKFVLWGDVFENVLDDVGLIFDSEVKAGFMTNFYSFYPKLEEKLIRGELKSIGLATLLDEALIYCSKTYKYKCLLDKENFSFISKNPPPYSSKCTANQRLQTLPSYIQKLYNRDSITVPPVDQIITLNDSKKINVSVGKTSELINLTLGERTGACMRIGGAAHDLFDFCLENENGFHVIFTNPETDKFVSRVSGFRNGNTVFLNQLRNSKDGMYSDNDLIEATNRLANYFLEKTKDSEAPIDNIVISNGYAMAGKTCQPLGVIQIKEGFDNFYSDVSSYAVLLASSNRDNSLVPVVLGPEKAEKYDVLRSKPKAITNSLEMKETIIRIRTIDQILNGNSLDEVVIPEYDINLDGKLYFGQDWYVLLDNNGSIKEKYIMTRNEKNMTSAYDEMTSIGLEISREETLSGGVKK